MPAASSSPGWHPLTVTALDDFNEEAAERVLEALRACNAAPSFARTVLAGRPYASVDQLVARAEEVARTLPWDEVGVALAGHPRIGDRVEGSSAEAQASRPSLRQGVPPCKPPYPGGARVLITRSSPG